jgi:hypothetical protein
MIKRLLQQRGWTRKDGTVRLHTGFRRRACTSTIAERLMHFKQRYALRNI